MSWVRGIPINAGILAGDVFQRVDTDMNMENWNVAPDVQSSILKYVQGGGQKWQSISISGLLRGQTESTRELYAAIDIEPSESSPYIHGQIRIDIEKSGSCFIYVYYRVWSDESTYTDINITSTSSLTIAPVELQRDDDIWLFFTLSNYQGESMIIVGFCGSYDLGFGREYPMEAYTMSYFDFIGNILLGTLPDKDSSPEYGDESDIGGGYNEDSEHGTFDDSSDEISIPNMPTLSPLSAGYFHAYYLADPETRLAWIGDALFPQDPLTQPDILSALGEVAQMLYFNKQIDYVVDCHVIPCIPTYGSNVPIKVGGRELKTSQGGTEYTIQAPQITNGYVDCPCGEIEIKEYWRNFLDFSYGTKCKLFLPFVGYVEILPEFFNGGKLGVKYRFNVVDGTFMCFVTSTSSKSKLKDSLIAQYSGCACMHIPLQSADYSRIIGGVVSTLTSVAGVASGNVAVAGAGLVGSLPNLVGQKPNVSSSNGYTASGSYMSKRTPYLIIERAKSQFSKNYPNEIGLPLNVTRSLATIHGLTIIENPVLNIDCSDEEYNEIVSLLKSGVIF
jgi:hypothetical protein